MGVGGRQGGIRADDRAPAAPRARADRPLGPRPSPARVAAAEGGADEALLLRLQATAGNRVATQLVSSVPAPAPGLVRASRAGGEIRRHRRPGDVEASKLDEYLDSRSADEGEPADARVAVEQNYAKSLRAGEALKQRGLKWFRRDADAPKPVPTEATVAAIEKAGYKTFWFREGSTIVVNTVRGKAFADYAPGEVKNRYDLGDGEDDQSYFYSNSFDPTTGEFHASVNFKNADEEVARQEGLTPPVSNSEIIWYQQHLVRGIVGDGASGIRSVSREEISNTQTLDTIFLCDDGDEAQDEDWIELDDPADDDVWALLGTPNGNSAVWLLVQHGAEAGLTDISSVAYTGDGLRITYL